MSAWGLSWGVAWGNSWGATGVASTAELPGNFRWDKKGKKRKRVIRYSDYESREKYAAELAKAALPIASVSIDNSSWEEIEDRFIELELTRLLH